MALRYGFHRGLIATVLLLSGLVVSVQGDTYQSRLVIANDGLEEEFPPSEHDPGLLRIGSRDFELGMEAIPPDRATDTPQRVFLRYQNLPIPAYSMIQSAHLSFIVQNANAAEEPPASLTIYGVADANQPLVDFAALPEPCPNIGCYYVQGLPKTDAFVHWDEIPLWPPGVQDGPNLIVEGPDQTTPNLAPIVEEVIGLAGWAEGNAIAFIIEPKVLEEIVDENGTVIGVELSRGTRETSAFRDRYDPPFNDGTLSPRLTIEFTPPIVGDLDCDGDVDFDDIDEFVLGLNNPAEYENQFGLPAHIKGDTDGDGDLDFDDINGFVNLLSGSGVEPVPEPSALVLVGSALALILFLKKM
jgi:hypothetical protein